LSQGIDADWTLRLLVPESSRCIAPRAAGQQTREEVTVELQILPADDFDLDCNGFLGSSVVEVSLGMPFETVDRLTIRVMNSLPGRLLDPEPWEWTGEIEGQ
jgi:hypothetical protein